MLWLVVGISGVSCAGKSTVAKSLFEYLRDPSNVKCLRPDLVIGTVKLLHQDDYYFPNEHPIHDFIPHMNQINSEQLKSLDTNQMHQDLVNILGASCQYFAAADVHRLGAPADDGVINVLIVEGFLIFNDRVVSRMCQLKFFIHASYGTAFKRRTDRPYDPPDAPGYFAEFVWPWYQRNFDAIECKHELILLDGDDSAENVFHRILDGVKGAFRCD